MTNFALADAARPAQCVILKLALLDYSIGHELLLFQQRNPLVTLSRAEFDKLDYSQQCAALIRAVLICSQTWEQNKRKHRWFRLWRWLNRKTDWPLAIAEFRNYYAAGTAFPNVLPPEGEIGREYGSTHLARLTGYACKRFGKDAFDKPLGFVQLLYFTEAEADGLCRIENNYERQVREEVAEFEEEYRKEQEAKCQR